MITKLAYFSVLGKPLIMYLGFLTLILLIITGIIGYGRARGKLKFSLNKHKWFAILTVIIAIIHGLLGTSVYFGW